MENIHFLKFFIHSNIVLLLSMLLIFIYFTNTSLLKKRGFTQEFIKFKKKDYTRRLIGIMIAVPILELIAAGITYLIYGELANANQLLITFIIFLVLVIPFPILDSIKTGKRHKILMEKTQSTVVADMKYKIFHHLFNPVFEIVASLVVLGYFIYFKDTVSPLITIHLALIWLMYILIRRAKNLNKPLLKESYYYTFLILGINHLLVIFHVVYPFFTRIECCANATMLMSGITLAMLLLLKMGYYLFNVPLMKRELRQ